MRHNLPSLHDTFIDDFNSMGSQSMAVGSVLTFEGARCAFEIMVRKWEVQEQLGASTSELLKIFCRMEMK